MGCQCSGFRCRCRVCRRPGQVFYDMTRPVLSVGLDRTVVSYFSEVWEKRVDDEWVRSIKTEATAPILAVVSPCGRILALAEGGAAPAVTLLLEDGERKHRTRLKRPARRLRFVDGGKLLAVADRGGEVILVEVEGDSVYSLPTSPGLLLDALVTSGASRFRRLITCDRDEKIRVCDYPEVYNVHSFCLGHTEYIGALESLPHDSNVLLSSSGDGSIKLWDLSNGKNSLTIDLNVYVEQNFLSEFQNTARLKGIEVQKLPVEHMACCKVDENASILVASLYSSSSIVLFIIHGTPDNIKYEFSVEIKLSGKISALNIFDRTLYVLEENQTLKTWLIDNKGKNINFSHAENIPVVMPADNIEDDILYLYKRKFDEIFQYQENKKLRLEKTKS